MELIDQINRATASELAGYKPMIDRLDRSFFELLSDIDDLAESMKDVMHEWDESPMQIQCMVSMIRAKLGFPASIHIMTGDNTP